MPVGLRLSPSLRNLVAMLDEDSQLNVRVRDGGFVPTFAPYNMEQRPKVRDHFFGSGTHMHPQRIWAPCV